MRVRQRAAMACALLALACCCGSIARGADVVEDGVSYGTSVAPPERVRAAKPIDDLQGPISRNEPNQCEGIDAPTVEGLGGTREGGGRAISPSDVELVGLEPNTDYVACISILNFEPSGPPLTGRIDDVDIVASNKPSGGIDVVDASTGVGTWIVPSTREFSVPPSSRMIIPYIVHTPDTMPAGTVVGGVAARFTSASALAQAITQRTYISSEGGQHRQVVPSRFDSSRLLGREGHKTFFAKFDVHNPSDYVESFDVDVKMTGLGRTVRRSRATNGALLPSGRMRVAAEVEDMPWIGIYRPTVTIKSQVGTTEKQLPWVFVLPPWPYVVAIILAILLPLVVLLRRWWKQRQEWMQYMDEFDDEDYEDEDLHEYGHV